MRLIRRWARRLPCLLRGHRWSEWAYSWAVLSEARFCDRCTLLEMR